jgi:hypothetical protein
MTKTSKFKLFDNLNATLSPLNLIKYDEGHVVLIVISGNLKEKIYLT